MNQASSTNFKIDTAGDQGGAEPAAFGENALPLDGKAEFVSHASHQLRTPLAIVGWYAEMLQGEVLGVLNDRQKKCLAEIVHANEIMVGLVNSLLNVSRIETGTFAIEPEAIDISEVARLTVRELEPAIFKRRLEVRETYTPGISLIVADRNLTKIILENLLSNAIKYTPEEGLVEIRVTEAEGGVEIVVADTGYGIPAEAQHRVFTKLFRAENVRMHETDGTGLGLYIVKSIVDAVGGDIRFESKEGEGSVFCVRIPSGGMPPKPGIARLT